MIEIFKNEQFGDIRVAGTNEEPMFCLADVCKALNLSNYRMVKDRLNGKGVSCIDTPTNGGNQSMLYINESNLYKAIFQSRKEEAEEFQEWITSDVIPSIRKHGMYATEKTIDKILSDPDFGIKLLTELKEERQRRIESERKNAILMHVNKTYTMTEIAKELNMKSAIELNNKLSDMKVQFKTNNTWVLYSKYSNLGYEEIKQEILDNGRVVYHRKITQSGRDFIINLINN